jgi:hypothetical protein
MRVQSLPVEQQGRGYADGQNSLRSMRFIYGIFNTEDQGAALRIGESDDLSE